MMDKKAIALLKKYYLPYRSDGQPSEAEKESAIRSAVSSLLWAKGLPEHKLIYGGISRIPENARMEPSVFCAWNV